MVNTRSLKRMKSGQLAVGNFVNTGVLISAISDIIGCYSSHCRSAIFIIAWLIIVFSILSLITFFIILVVFRGAKYGNPISIEGERSGRIMNKKMGYYIYRTIYGLQSITLIITGILQAVRGTI